MMCSQLSMMIRLILTMIFVMMKMMMRLAYIYGEISANLEFGFECDATNRTEELTGFPGLHWAVVCPRDLRVILIDLPA